jgi:creatinine amidohydrolase/Fe(II)-dependent formamide hydrolase-like protein
VKQKKVVVVPIGSIEQHGPHLPLDVDMLEVTAVAQTAARLVPDEVLVLPTQVNGYTGHVMLSPHRRGERQEGSDPQRLHRISQGPVALQLG